MDELAYKVGLAIDTVSTFAGKERYVVMYYNVLEPEYCENLPSGITIPYIHVKKNVDGEVKCFLHNASSEQWQILHKKLRDVLKEHKTYLGFSEYLSDELLPAGENRQYSPASYPVPPTQPKPECNTGRVPLFVPSPPYAGEKPDTLRRHGGEGDYVSFEIETPWPSKS